jgi:hypothetical protein
VAILSAGQLLSLLVPPSRRLKPFFIPILVALCLSIFISSSDFHLLHVLRPNSEKIAYRMGAFEKFWSHWYHRYDFSGAAEFVNEAASVDSKIVVSYNLNTVSFYLDKPHAIYWPRENPRFRLVSRKGGSVELWSNMPLLSTKKDLVEYSQKSNEIWLIVLDRYDPFLLVPEELWPQRFLSLKIFSVGIDKHVQAWKIRLRPSKL